MLYSLKLICVQSLNLLLCFVILHFQASGARGAMLANKSCLGNYVWDGNWISLVLGFRLFKVSLQLQRSPKTCCGIKDPWPPCFATQDSPWHLLPPCMFQECRGTVPLSGTVHWCFCSVHRLCPGGEVSLHHPLFIFPDPFQGFFLDLPG